MIIPTPEEILDKWDELGAETIGSLRITSTDMHGLYSILIHLYQSDLDPEQNGILRNFWNWVYDIFPEANLSAPEPDIVLIELMSGTDIVKIEPVSDS